MTVLDFLSNSACVPGRLRYRLQEARLRPLLAADLNEADVLLEIARERLPHCVSRYSRKRLGYYVADVPTQCGKLQEAAGRQSLATRGRKRFDALSRALRVTFRTIQEVCEQDASHEEEVLALRADRDRLEREAAPLRVGIAEAEFRRYDGQFHQRSLAFERCRDLAEVNDCHKDLRNAVAAVERLVEKRKRIEEGIRSATATFDCLDRGTLSADPRTDEVYVQTAELLALVRERVPRGEVDRSIALLDQVDQNLQTLARQADHVRRDAGIEVELWRRVAVICPRAASSFASELSKTPLEPSGDSLAEWMVLRRSFEKAVNRLAYETRSANAEALHKRALNYQWRDPDERRLLAFARHSYRAWRDAVSQPVEKRASAGST